MKLFYLVALEGVKARRVKLKDECDRAHLPDIPHGEWSCKYDGIESDEQHPEEVCCKPYAAYYEQFELRRPKLGPSIFLLFTELFSSVILSVMAGFFMTTLEKHPLDVS